MPSGVQQLFPGKQFISTVLEALETKTTMSGHLARRYLQRAGMAGLIVGTLFAANFVAVALRYSTVLDGAAFTLMEASAANKREFVTSGAVGWGDLFIRAVLCNFLINPAMLLVYNGLVQDDVLKSLVMIVAVFLFAFLGLEHSVANTVLFTIVGLGEGIDGGLAAVNVAIALVGNFLGGGVLIGLYYAYVNDGTKCSAGMP